MRGIDWNEFVNEISLLKPEYVDKGKILKMLSQDRTWSHEVVDSLYIAKIITIDEYKVFMGKYIERLEESLKWAKEMRKDAEENGESFNPMTYYLCACRSFGPTIDMEKQN